MSKCVFGGDSWTLTRNVFTDSEVVTVEAGEWKGLFEIETDIGLKIRAKGATGDGESCPVGKSTRVIRIGTGGLIQVKLPAKPLTPVPHSTVRVTLIELINNERLLEYEVTTGAATGLKIYDANAPFKFEILDVTIQARGTSTNGTMKLTDGTTDITDAIIVATDKAITEAGTIDDAKSTIAKNGTLEVVCAGDAVASTKGLLKITIAERE